MSSVVVTRSVVSVLDISCDAFAADFFPLTQPPHTALVFVPGNPGLIDWYIDCFTRLVERLGPGFCARGIANAGHSLNVDRIRIIHNKQHDARRIAWTVEGQVRHKAAYVDHILQELLEQDTSKSLAARIQLVFISHSIGAHLTTRLLLLRPDLLERTRLLLHLMPFVRMDAPFPFQTFFNFGARHPAFTVAVTSSLMSVLAALPECVVQLMLRLKLRDEQSRSIGVSLIRAPDYATNFFTLGTEEIRDVPEIFDVSACKLVWIDFCLGCCRVDVFGVYTYAPSLS
jgi:pimeloyl-ACP methyl ester carboxylesterase